LGSYRVSVYRHAYIIRPLVAPTPPFLLLKLRTFADDYSYHVCSVKTVSLETLTLASESDSNKYTTWSPAPG
jgi:hypothetical protein